MSPICVTETELWLAEPLSALRRMGMVSEAYAIAEWFTFHGIDPRRVLLTEQPVVRDPVNYQIRYPSIVGGKAARKRPPEFITVIDQGEGSPLPWPDALRPHWAARRATFGTATDDLIHTHVDPCREHRG